MSRQNSFRRWFSQSKVTRDDGSPLVVYHGTNQDIQEFSVARLGQNTGAISARAFYFTESPAEADEYAQLSARNQISNAVEREANCDRLLKAISIAARKGNFDLEEKLTLELEELEHEAMTGEERGANILPVFLHISNPMVLDLRSSADLCVVAQAIESAQEHGHDGLKLINVFDPVRHRPVPFDTTQWIAFRPEQIQSAIGSNCAPVVDRPQCIDKPLLTVVNAVATANDAHGSKTACSAQAALPALPPELVFLARLVEGKSYGAAKRAIVAQVGSVEPREKFDDDVADAVFLRLQQVAQVGRYTSEADLAYRQAKRLEGAGTIILYRSAPPGAGIRPGDFAAGTSHEAGFYQHGVNTLQCVSVPRQDVLSVAGSMGGGAEYVLLPIGHVPAVATEHFVSLRSFLDMLRAVKSANAANAARALLSTQDGLSCAALGKPLKSP